MKIVVQGVSIELTKEQIEQIDQEKAKQFKECSTFTKTLKSFGLKKMSTQGWANPDSNCWKNKNWVVSILDSGKHNEYCAVTGVGIDLDSSGWPITAWSPVELCGILNKALEEINNT